MSDLKDLYQQLILDHYKHPRNRRKLEPADRSCEGFNPLCGDRLTVYLQVHEDMVEDICFEGSGCAISTASASLMTESLKGKTVQQAQALFEEFHRLVTVGPSTNTEPQPMGKLVVFAGISKYPARVKCASLAWHTFRAALENAQTVVSTERE